MNLSDLIAVGIYASINADGGLLLDAPKGVLSNELIERIRQSKQVLIAEIKGACEVGELGELHRLCMNPPGRGDTSEADTSTAIRSTLWLLHFVDRNPQKVLTAPPTSHDQILADYPTALAAEPLAPIMPEPPAAAISPSCRICRHCKRPGRADPGYCGGGRDDLPDAYGVNHPLRKLPDDGGASCAHYTPNED